MTPWWVLVAVALVMGGVGHLTGRRLATGGYRIVEDEAAHPVGHPWWTGPATAGLSVVAAWSIGDLGDWAALPVFLLFAWLTVGLVWVDLDVHRLPVGLVVPTGAALLALLVPAVAATDAGRWVGIGAGAAILGSVYLVMAVLPGGGVGGGDVRLAPVIGGVLGYLGIGAALVGMAAGFLLGGLGALVLLAGRRVGGGTPIAYGPAMCLGAWLAIGLGDRISTGVIGG